MKRLNVDTVKKYMILLVLIVMILFFSVMNSRFVSVSNLLNVLRQAAMMGISSIGVMFVLLIGGIDLSVGSQVAFVNVLCAYLMAKMGFHPVLAVLICMVVSTFTGLLMGLLVTKCRIPPFIATLSFMNILKGVALIICQGLPISGFPISFKVLGQGYLGIIPIPVILMVVVFILGAFVLNKTYIGRYFYAIGGNEEAARLSGIQVDKIKCLVYSLSALCACFGGMITLSRLNSGSPQTGSGFEFDVITALVLGGVSISGGAGKISGAIVGVMIMGVLSNGLVMMNVNEYLQTIIKGVVLALAVSIDCLQQYANSKKAQLPVSEEKADA